MLLCYYKNRKPVVKYRKVVTYYKLDGYLKRLSRKSLVRIEYFVVIFLSIVKAPKSSILSNRIFALQTVLEQIHKDLCFLYCKI